MLPISLTIQGLYSYKTRQTIDFRLLTNDHLFGIFGAVGSGKSSILDAVCFVLYDKVERLGKNERKDLFNQQSGEFLIDFEFESGAESQVYRFVVRNSRTKKGEPKNFERSAYVWKSDDWSPLPDTDARKVFNLSYDNFKRTVIIPQGRFQEFLQLGGKERTQMLMELFPKVAEFDLQDRVAIKKKATELELAGLAGNLEALGAINETDVESENQKIADAEASLKIHGEKLKQADLTFKNLENLRLVFEELDKATHALQMLEMNKSNQEVARKNLDHYELTFKAFDADFKLLDKAKADAEKATAQLGSTQTGLDKTEKLLQKAKGELETAKNAADLVPDWEKQLSDWSQVAQILKLKAQIRADEEVLSKLKQKLEAGIELANTKKERLQTSRTEVEKTESGMPDLRQLSEAEQFFAEENRLNKEMTDQSTKLETIDRKLLDLKNQKEVALTPNIRAVLPNVNTDSKMSELLRSLSDYRLVLDQQISELQRDKEQLLKKDHLFEFTTHLTEGEPCPLCGSVHHPEVISAEDVSILRSKNEKNALDKSNLLKEIGLVETKLSGLQAELKGVMEARKDLMENQQKTQASLDELRVKLASNSFYLNGPEAVQAHLETNRNNQAHIAKLKTEIRELEQNIQSEAPGIEKLQTEQIAQNQKLASTRGQSQGHEAQIKTLKVDDWKDKELSSIEHLITQLEKKISEARSAFESAQVLSQALEKDFNQWNTTLTVQKEAAEKANAERDAHTEKVSQKITRLQLGDQASIRQTLAQMVDTVSVRKSIDAFFTDLLKAEEKVKNLKEKTGNQTFNEAEWTEANRHYTEINASFLQEKGKLMVLVSDLDKLKQALDKQAGLREKIKQLELRQINLNTLYNLFRGQAFVNYASGIYLKNIVEMANERFFRLTRQKLRLVLDADNNFYVKDYLNGGHERLAKTLSGGQIFQASLSLALALADSVRHLTQSPRNFFFLDEGFGSLDKEALRLVFDTLHHLRHENRIVGVISHVEEMQQEIGNCLLVRLDEEKGSLVEMAN